MDPLRLPCGCLAEVIGKRVVVRPCHHGCVGSLLIVNVAEREGVTYEVLEMEGTP